jgi:hypothetical protein
LEALKIPMLEEILESVVVFRKFAGLFSEGLEVPLENELQAPK